MRLTLILLFLFSRFAAGESATFSIKPVTIWSDGTRMAGDLYLPNDLKPDEKRATMLFCAGAGGVAISQALGRGSKQCVAWENVL